MNETVGKCTCAQASTVALRKLKSGCEDGKNRAFYKPHTGSREKEYKRCQKGCSKDCDEDRRDGKMAKGIWIVQTMLCAGDTKTNAHSIGNEVVSIESMEQGGDWDCAG